MCAWMCVQGRAEGQQVERFPMGLWERAKTEGVCLCHELLFSEER